MAFLGRVGNLLRQSQIKHAGIGLSSSNSLLFQASRSMSSAKLFVGGLAYATDEMGLREAFQQYGDVMDARVITDRDSGRSRGFGFVSFTSADAANIALQDMDGKELHGRRIRVSFAQERPRPSFGGGGYGGVGGGSFGGAGGGGGYGGGAGDGYGGAGGYSGGGYGGAGGNSGGGYVGAGGYSGASYGSSGGYGGSSSNNAGGFNPNAGGGDDLFSGGLGGGSGQEASPGGNDDGVDGNLNHDLAGNEGVDEIEDDDYANTSNK